MKTRRRGETGKLWPWHPGLVGLLVTLFLGGCNATRSKVEKSLMADRGHNSRAAGVVEVYNVACPDVLQVSVEGRPQLACKEAVDADGRLELPELGTPRVEGKNVTQIAREIATLAGIEPARVQVRVVAHRSQRIFLFGQVTGQQRSLPYVGQETVLDLLQRAGGITPGAEPADVHIIRGHVSDGKRPEVFRVDLRSIVLTGDASTNVRLQPFDQVHVGETREARVQRCIPPWLRPLWQAILDTQPRPQPPRGSPPNQPPSPTPPIRLVNATEEPPLPTAGYR